MLGGDRRGGGGTRGPAAGRRAAAQTLQQDRAAQGVGPGAWRDVRAKQTPASRLAGLRALLASRLAGLAPCRQPFSPELSPPAPRRPRKTFLLFSSFSLSCLHLSQLFLPYSVILFPSFFSFLVLNFFFIVAKYVT